MIKVRIYSGHLQRLQAYNGESATHHLGYQITRVQFF